MKTINISGAKNSILPIICATLIEKNIYYINNVPKIEDVYTLIKILKQFNATVNFINKNGLIIDTQNIIFPEKIIYDNNCRGTYYFIGAISIKVKLNQR